METKRLLFKALSILLLVGYFSVSFGEESTINQVPKFLQAARDKVTETTPAYKAVDYKALANLPGFSTSQSPDLAKLPGFSTTRQPKDENTLERCMSKLSDIIEKITEDSINEVDENGKKTGYLGRLLDNQVELSFAKVSRMFLKTKQELENESTTYVEKKKTGLDVDPGSIAKMTRNVQDKFGILTKKEREAIVDFFQRIPDRKGVPGVEAKIKMEEFDRMYDKMQLASQRDRPMYWLNDADKLIFDSILNYTTYSGETPTDQKLKDRILDEMRRLFPTRNFDANDISANDAHIQKISKARKDKSYKSFKRAKDAFVKNAQEVIEKYLKEEAKDCQKHFLVNGKVEMLKLRLNARTCDDSSYLSSLLHSEPFDDVTQLLNYMDRNNIKNKSYKPFLKLAGLKHKVNNCQMVETKDGKSLTIDMNLTNLPADGGHGWVLDCDTCRTKQTQLHNNKKLKTLNWIETIPMESFTDDIALTDTWSNQKIKINVERDCTKSALPETAPVRDVASETDLGVTPAEDTPVKLTIDSLLQSNECTFKKDEDDNYSIVMQLEISDEDGSEKSDWALSCETCEENNKDLVFDEEASVDGDNAVHYNYLYKATYESLDKPLTLTNSKTKETKELSIENCTDETGSSALGANADNDPEKDPEKDPKEESKATVKNQYQGFPQQQFNQNVINTSMMYIKGGFN